MCFAALRCVPERDVQNESSYGVRCSVFLCRSALQCVSARCSVCVCCGALQCVAARCSLCVCCNTLQCVAASCSVCVCCSALQCVAERDMQDEALYCTLPRGPGSSCTFLSATHCNTPNTPQHTATHWMLWVFATLYLYIQSIYYTYHLYTLVICNMYCLFSLSVFCTGWR